METEILDIINYLKKVGKKRVTYEKINLELRKKNLLMKETDFETVIDSPVNSNKLQLRGMIPTIHILQLPIEVIQSHRHRSWTVQIVTMKIQFIFQMSPKYLMKHNKMILLRRFTGG